MAGELRLPLVRLVDGTGGGGSVTTLDSPDARTYVPEVPGMERVGCPFADFAADGAPGDRQPYATGGEA